MNLECLNDIITNNLAIHIDLTDLKSWNLNTGLTAFSLTKWNNAISNNINLVDFGLTSFDNGRTNTMWSGITLMPSDTLFSMYRVGYNDVYNPTTGETSGITTITQFLPMSATSASGGSLNYFDLSGGYLQGFFKLDGYDYELLPARYNDGITIETLLYLYPNSSGIFYMMGARAEDKYNTYFSGETMINIPSGITSNTTIITPTGVTSSLNNFLDSITEKFIPKMGFKLPEDMMRTSYSETQPIKNIENNVIAFELTQDRRLAYKYVDANGMVITNASPTVVAATGFTMIDMVFTPDAKIDDPDLIDCAPQRLGKLIFYVNGRSVWIIKEFPEYYFKSFANDKEKQLGVPYSISWGGGSFGLEHSYHYDYQTYVIYHNQDSSYINSKFIVEADPISTECYIAPTGDTILAGFSLSANSNTFKYLDNCDSNIEHALTVMQVEYTGGTGNTYFLKFNQPISVLSNRDYVANLSIYVDNLFSGGTNNVVSMLMYSDITDVNIVSDIEYVNPITENYILSHSKGLYPWGFGEEYEYSLNGVLYYGVSGLPVTLENSNVVGYDTYNPYGLNYVVTGNNIWLPITSKFRTPDNSGQNNIYLGLLVKTDGAFNVGGRIYVKNFTYTAEDILVIDDRKNNLTIEQNFKPSFVGGIQKLRIYDRAFTSPEVLHNALIESINHPEINLIVNKGGRIIYR